MPPEQTAPKTIPQPTAASSQDPGPPATDVVPVTLPHPHVNAASDALAAVLVGEPDDLELALHVAEAIDVLADVHPPLPPLEYPEVGTSAENGIETALNHLRAAVETAGPDEALRAGRAAALLRQALGPRDELGLLPPVLQ